MRFKKGYEKFVGVDYNKFRLGTTLAGHWTVYTCGLQSYENNVSLKIEKNNNLGTNYFLLRPTQT